MQYLASFKPLNINKYGQVAVETFGLPPYVDCSCRREPDLESRYPSISALCHFTKLAPRLHEGDSVVYITVKGKYPPLNHRHWRLVAIMKVRNRFESHEDAAAWYKAKNLVASEQLYCRRKSTPAFGKDNGAVTFNSFWKYNRPATDNSLVGK
jgi:hypothetical protein